MDSSSPAPSWIPVAHGTLADLAVLRGLLDANRIPTDVPMSALGEATGLFSSGGGRFDLCVPDACERRARALLGTWPKENLDVAERMEHGSERER